MQTLKYVTMESILFFCAHHNTIKHELAIAVGIDVPKSFQIQELPQLRCVNQRAVVGKADTLSEANVSICSKLNLSHPT